MPSEKVDVNEQNPRALAFYQAKGFKIIGRDSTDEAGRPYPILHLYSTSVAVRHTETQRFIEIS